jgi:hypothetical protein
MNLGRSRSGRRKGEGKVPGSGRKPGTPNKATLEVREHAKGYGPKVIEGLFNIFETSNSDAARVAAGREILDRGYGRPPQAVTGADEGPIVVRHIVSWLK